MSRLRQDQIARLQAPLDQSRVKGRTQGGRSVAYIEGYDCINIANDIFDFDGWTTDLVDGPNLTQIGTDGGYVCHANVKVSVRCDDGSWVHRTEVGCCTPATAKGTAPSADAVDTAMKGAVTDALKRALRLFGNQFGNSLYDKDSAAHGANAGATSKPAAAAQTQTSAPAGATKPCPNCGGVMRFNSGVKGDKAWSGFFCENQKENGCAPQWNK
jgi:DNA repair and recombination protein RAD52